MADNIPSAPPSRPDLAETWATVAAMERHSQAAYRAAGKRIRQRVAGYERIGIAELAEIHRMLDVELKRLEQEQNGLLQEGMLAAVAAAALGRHPAAPIPPQGGEHLLVRHLLDTPQKDGLNLSARLWRIHAGAARDLKSTVDVAVQRGWDAEHTLQRTLKLTPELRQALDEAGAGAVAKRLEAGLLTDPNNAAMKFRRVLRTEINRAHGERYKQLAREDDNVVGLRFMLSPRHPRVDICDEHAAADLYGLGQGVYPVDECPWPAHPNTFSYTEAVYKDEVGSLNPTVKQAPEIEPINAESFERSYLQLERQVAELKAAGATTLEMRQILGRNQKLIAAVLNNEQQRWLNTSTAKVFLSDDTLIKQIAHHGEQLVTIQHYLNLQDILDKAQVVVRSNTSSVLFFRKEERIMRAVLKTTRDGKEVYLTSLHVSDEKSIRRALNKNTVFKNEYGMR